MAAKKKTAVKKEYKSKSSWNGKKSYTPEIIVKKPRFIPPNNYWLPQFEAVFDFGLNGKGHGAVKAVAGSGKTTALVELLFRYMEKYPFHDVCAIAFNASIRKELNTRVPDKVVCHTTHSAGYQCVIKVWGNGKAAFDLQGPKGYYPQSLAENAIGFEKEKEDDRDALMHAVSLSKTRLAQTVEEIIEVMDYWSIDSSLKKEDFAKHVISMLDQMKRQPGTGHSGQKAITYDDQVWLPIVNNWTPPKLFDLILVDEAQDLSPARTAIVKKMLKPGGRIIVVGDEFQAIYNFAGADIHALPDLIKELNATELPLTCSFRCAKAVVREAQQYNPEITWSENAPEGKIETLSPNEMLKFIKPGDAIISRTNAPLVKYFFRLAKQGVKVKMLGRDFAASIGVRVNGWQKKAKKNKEKFTGEDLLDKNQEWVNEQIAYFKKKKQSPDRAIDEAETISSLCEDLPVSLNSEAAVKEVLSRISSIFAEDEDPIKGEGKNCVTLSSTHKFKGLERDRVCLLLDTYRPGDGDEERNLMYVACTRAKTHLVYVKGKFTN